MNYYLGAYHLMKLKPLTFGKFKGQKILTGCKCLNESYFDAWSLSWTEDGKKNLSKPKEEFNINDSQVKAIQDWSDLKFNEKHLGWINTFNDFETLREYKIKFFNNATDFEIIGIYFPENSIEHFKYEFEPQSDKTGAIGIWDCLNKKTIEQFDNEEFIGYDLIGVEFSGDYHSFHCYDYTNELVEKFRLTINKHGLINEFDNKQDLLEFANNPDNGFPFVPWYLVKVKRIKYK